jgi:hypothetical protein
VTFLAEEPAEHTEVAIEKVQVTDKEATVMPTTLEGATVVIQELVTVAEEEEAKVVPSEYRLYQNRPNPFNAVTQIAYDLPRVTWVQLAVCTITGQEVAVLVDGEREAGYYSVSWDASGLSSGMYVVRMEAGNFVETRKMMLLR